MVVELGDRVTYHHAGKRRLTRAVVREVLEGGAVLGVVSGAVERTGGCVHVRDGQGFAYVRSEDVKVVRA